LILKIHVWGGVFVFMRMVFSRWIIIENLLVFSVLTHGFGALVNVILNIILIPGMGGVGAAIATLISYAVSSYLALLLLKKSRGMFWMMTKALLAPFRYPAKVFQVVVKRP